ncbi:HAUS augmin-like complex subunit 1 [Geospiza fortis]|uniref:HAUS augmin-like complex subunit 1 n=2 Tax=Thraupidae TaxID=400783 RepID=A0A6I9Z6S8_GEOFO|nr:HAUS augmin-like complex subunit 1 [Geospiza fortis]XP_030824619.1 HAUS augmin-like complex subunit 1 [Camarhynchus parvulus]
MAAAGTPGGDSFQEKLTRVTIWLKKLYGGVPFPEYEVNERTVDILHEIMESNEERDKDVMLLIEDMKDRTSKYEAEADYWQDILGESLGFLEGSMSKEANDDLTDLVQSAIELEVEDTSLTSFYSAINDMTLEMYKTKSKNEEMEQKLRTLRKKLTSALMVEKQLEKDIEKLKNSQEAQQAKAETQSKNMKFLEDKSKDLKIRICDAEAKLVASGLDQSLTHEALVKSSEELVALREEIKPLKKELASYLDLPPSIPLAQVKVEEVKKELKALDEELTREIEALPFELT